ncbi:hypothetical protein MASR2M54_22180 [Aliarcobacter cryaerophilus]
MKQKPLLSYFYSFFAVWFVASVLLFLYGGFFALYQGTILSVLELSLSFDNAVVNATILATMALVWRKISSLGYDYCSIWELDLYFLF